MTQYFSMPTAVVLTLLAAAMWGSWMQVVKLKKDFPIAGIVFWLYLFSFVFVWAITLVLAPSLLPQGIWAVTMQNLPVIGKILLGGAMMSVGMLLSLTVMHSIGLMLATTLSGTITSILGIFTSVSEEGLPDNPFALPLIIATTVVFLLASFVCSYASQQCGKDRLLAQGGRGTAVKQKSTVTFKVVLMILLNSVLANGWSIGTASGTAAGLPPILTCAYLCTGSTISTLLVCGFLFTRQKCWKTIFCVGTSKQPLLLGVVSGLCHYGGNLMSIYSMPTISATLSFLFGRTANLWTYFWGFYYKEFQGARKKTLAVLSLGLLLYFGGLGLLFLYNFS